MMKLFLRISLGLVCILISLWLIAPTLVIIPISFSEQQSLVFPPRGFSWRWYQNIFESQSWKDSMITSLQVAVIVSILATLLGSFAALGIEHLKNKFGGMLKVILLTPIVMPGVVLAIGIYAIYLKHHLIGTYTGFILAHTLLALPFVVISVSANLAVFDNRLETAAASLGASKITTLLTVTIPLTLPGILSGILFSFVTSFNEIVISLFISSPQVTTLPVKIYSSITRDTDPTIAAIGSITFAVTTLLIGIGLLSSLKRKK
ncbi:MAG: ABC transporter permease [Gibbsiella quercinecans]|uniref:ABC transporter permease n=1 Tax=Gibbsiella quercinecans TaxID=929813 RepID=UPI003F2B28E5